MNKDLLAIFEYMEREKGIKREVIVAAIEDSLRIAAKKTLKQAANIAVHINPKTGDVEVTTEKEIVNEVEDASRQISLEESRELDPECEVGQFIDIPVETKDLGRIAANTARQVIMQKVRMAERDVIHEEYRHRQNEIVSGTVKRLVRGNNLIVDLGKVEAIMPMREYPKTEKYQVGDRVRALLMTVRDSENGGAEVVLSRSSPEFVKQLFIQEVPEVADEVITIENIVREAGYRTKLIVKSHDMKIDPVGACVGTRGSRVKNIIRELNNEKIDIIPYTEDSVSQLQNILHPIEIRKILVEDEKITIVIDDDNFAAAVGKKGLNVRLSSALIGKELEIQRMTAYNLAMAEERSMIAEASDTSLDANLDNLELSSLIVDQLSDAGYDTLRKVLSASPEELAKIPGISIDVANMILEQARKQRTNTLG